MNGIIDHFKRQPAPPTPPTFHVILQRWVNTPTQGTFGEIFVGGSHWYTIERPWLDNKPNVSCIPAGTYDLVRSRFYKGDYDTWEITGVPDRSEIKLHVANAMTDLLGCIGPGTGLGVVKNRWAVTGSKAAHSQFMQAMDEVMRTHERVIIQISEARWFA